MSDFLTELASKAGISPEQAKKGMGALLAFIKEHLPAEHFARLSQDVPGTEDMMADAGAEPGAEHGSGGGILSAVAGAVSKMFGGEGSAALLGKLGQLGLSPEQIKSFLPRAIAFLKSKLPPEAMAKISAMLPAEETPAS